MEVATWRWFATEVISLLNKMQLQVESCPSNRDPRISVSVPPTRSDILHARDLAEDIIFPPDGQGSVDKVAAQSSSMAQIRILSLVAKLFTVSSGIATAIRDSNLLSLFGDEIKDRRDMLKTLSVLEVLYEDLKTQEIPKLIKSKNIKILLPLTKLVEHPHSNIFLLKINLLQLIIDVIKYSADTFVSVFSSYVISSHFMLSVFWSLCSDSSADSIIRSRGSID